MRVMTRWVRELSDHCPDSRSVLLIIGSFRV